MKLRGHGNGVAIALAAIALVIATTGTAVAVTATVVNIADPNNPSQVARVDNTGRLKVNTPTSPIDSTGLAFVTDGDNFVTSPTKATLAITKISFNNPSVNAAATFAEVRYYLYKVGVDTGGSCTLASASLLGIYDIAAGDDFEDTFPAPLIIQPTGSAKYCLDLYAITLNGTYSASYFPDYNIAGYVAAGTYTGIGANLTHTDPRELQNRERTATH